MRNGRKRIGITGAQTWYLDGKLHRKDDLPAIIYPHSHQIWCRHGEYHRENDLPAVIWEDGLQKWYLNGKCHRENGPAIIYADGSQEWYRHGKHMSVAKWTRDNDITASWKTWDDVTWSLFHLEFL